MDVIKSYWDAQFRGSLESQKYTASLLDEGRTGRRWGEREKKPSNEIFVAERSSIIYLSLVHIIYKYLIDILHVFHIQISSSCSPSSQRIKQHVHVHAAKDMWRRTAVQLVQKNCCAVTVIDCKASWHAEFQTCEDATGHFHTLSSFIMFYRVLPNTFCGFETDCILQ